MVRRDTTLERLARVDAAQVDDHAHTPTSGADARADRIDVVVVRPDGDLGAVARFTGTGLDLDDAVGDFRHLEAEQALDELGMAPGDDDLRALPLATNLQDVGLDPVPSLQTLIRNALGRRHDGLGVTKVENGEPVVGRSSDDSSGRYDNSVLRQSLHQ